MQHWPKYGLCNPEWVNRPGFSMQLLKRFLTCKFSPKGVKLHGCGPKRRLQLSTVVILINGNDQNFENNGVMPKLRGSKKNLRTFWPPKISFIQASIHFNRIFRNYFVDWKVFLKILDLLKINFTNKCITFKKTAVFKNMKRMENYIFAEFL